MSDKKPIMVRFDPEDYETLRRYAYRSRLPVAVLARTLIMQQLDSMELMGSMEGDMRLIEETHRQDSAAPEPLETPSSSSPGRRSPNAKRSKKKRGK